MSILMSALSGLVAVLVMLATFYVIRRARLHRPGGLAAALLQSNVRLDPLFLPAPPVSRRRITLCTRAAACGSSAVQWRSRPHALAAPFAFRPHGGVAM